MDEKKVPEAEVKVEEKTEEKTKKASIMKKFPTGVTKSSGNLPIIIGSLLVVLLGVGTGWLLSGSRASTGSGAKVVSEDASGGKGVDDGSEIGEETEEAIEAEGMLLEGGLDGEGTYRLERDGGPARTVCLTSTVLDLSSFRDKKVMVWGETMSSVQCPWLMDVVKIKEIE
jgi:hypothetical protein